MKKLISFLTFIFLIKGVRAHCPLCTVGAAAAAGGAAYLGVNKAIIGLFLGAFAVSTGWWLSGYIKKKYVPHQRALIVIVSFLLTIIPLLAVITNIYPLYVSVAGEYGSLLNRTYLIDLGLIGSILGGAVVCVTPWLSRKISGFRDGKIFPFQGVILTLLILILFGGIIQVFL